MFNGTSSLNTNTFGIDPVSNENMVYYNSANGLFKFHNQYDKNVAFQLSMKITTNAISVGTKFQYRFVVPDGISAGVDLTFPFPDGDGYADIAGLFAAIGSVNHEVKPINVYANQLLRDKGVKIQMKLSSLITLGTVNLNSADLVILG